jgi:hypothetical protein
MEIVTDRRTTRRVLLVAVTVLSALLLGFGIGIAHAADPRLDEADQALQKAYALVEASQTGGTVSAKAQNRFDKAVGNALADIEDARAEIVEAKLAADSP